VGTLGWIITGGLLMSLIALFGAVTFALPARTRERLILPLVAFSAGSLLAGALLHMIPEAVSRSDGAITTYLWVLAGFTTFLALEQFLHWHHWHDNASHVDVSAAEREHSSPLSLLMVIGDSIHNFLGGVAVAGAFVVDIGLGITTWLVSAAHEVPQELGKYGVLIHGGWSRGRAIIVNGFSSLTFLLGGIIAYAISIELDVSFLVPFAAGNFLYIAASDLVPEVNRHHLIRTNLVHFTSFAAGISLLLAIKVLSGE
jgi:zinc and cadmium transporter